MPGARTVMDGDCSSAPPWRATITPAPYQWTSWAMTWKRERNQRHMRCTHRKRSAATNWKLCSRDERLDRHFKLRSTVKSWHQRKRKLNSAQRESQQKTTLVGCRGGSRYVDGCWGFPYLKIKKVFWVLAFGFYGLWFHGFVVLWGFWFYGCRV